MKKNTDFVMADSIAPHDSRNGVFTLAERDQLKSIMQDYKIREAKLQHQLTQHRTTEIILREDKRTITIKHLILETDHSNVQDTLDTTAQQLEMETRRSTRLTKQMSALQKEKNILHKTNTELTTSAGGATTLRKDLKERDLTIKKLEKRVEEMERCVSVAKQETENLKSDLTDEKEATKAARAELRTTKESVTAKGKKEKNESVEKMKELEKNLKSMTAEVKALNKQNESLTSELEASKKEAEKVDKAGKEKATVASKATELEKLLKKANTDIKKLTKQVEGLQSDLETHDAEAEKSSSIFKEKLALQRQITTLEAENESLKISSENHRELLTEKHQLTHQVDSLQVELENERKASKRASKSQTDTTDLKRKHDKELKELKEQLAKLTKTTERATREREKEQADAEANKAVLEKKIETLKNKLRNEKATTAAAGNPRKRPANAFDAEDSPQIKKAKKSTTLKSTFSTTPFLKRAQSIMPPSPEASSSPPARHEETATTVEEPTVEEATTIPAEIDNTYDAPSIADDTVLSAALMPPPPPPPPAALKSKAAPALPKSKRAPSEAPKLLLGKGALAHTKRAPSIAPTSTRPSLLDDDTPPRPKSKTANGKVPKTSKDKENSAPEDDDEVEEPIKVKKPKMRKLFNNTLGNTLFDDDGEEGTIGGGFGAHKMRAPSVMGFDKVEFSPLKKRGAAFERIRQQSVLRK